MPTSAFETAGRSAALVAAAPGWVWPRWLERRLDPTSPAADVCGPLDVLVNDAARRWTAVGVLDGPGVLSVDAVGLLAPAGAGWSLDWWIGADDRWHVPAREAAVRQQRAGVGVVETAMRIPGGDAVQRVYGVRLPAADGNAAVAVVEVENASPAPFALALSIRPVTMERVGWVSSVAVDGAGVLVDGRRALLLARPPRRAAASTLAAGDAAGVVFGGAAPEQCEPVTDPAGLAHATVLMPVAHRTRVRAVLPLYWEPEPGEVPTRRRRRGARRRDAPGTNAAILGESFPDGLPDGSQVTAGWDAHLAQGARLDLGEEAFAAAAKHAAARLVMAATTAGALDDLLGSGPDGLAAVLQALGGHGFDREAADLLVNWFDALAPDGAVPGSGAGSSPHDATAVALWALGQQWERCRDRTLLRATAVAATDAARVVLASLAPGNPEPSSVASQAWRLAGLEAAAVILRASGDDASVATVEHGLAACSSGAPSPERLPRRDAPAVVRAAALGVGVPMLEGALGALGGTTHGAPLPEPGRGGDLALGFAAALARSGRGGGEQSESIAQLLGLAAATGAWPARLHPRTGEGCAGSGDDPVAAAWALLTLRSLLVRERPDGVDLCPAVSSGRLGVPVEVHGVRTRVGTLSFAVRWHGRRPALLWEVVAPGEEAAAEGAASFEVRAPGLDAAWSTREREGDALLAEVLQPRG